MKIVIESDKFKRMLSALLMYKGSALIDSIPVQFTEKGAIARSMELSVAGFHSGFGKEFFSEYSIAEGGESVPFTSSIFDAIKGFDGSEKLTIESDGDKITVKGKRDTYVEDMIEKKTEFTVNMVATKYGVIPKTLENDVKKARFLLDVQEIKKLPSADKYTFVTDSESLNIIIETVGVLTRIISLKERMEFYPLHVSFDGEYMQRMCSNLDGDVTVTMSNDVIVMSEKTKDSAISYLLMAQGESVPDTSPAPAPEVSEGEDGAL